MRQILPYYRVAECAALYAGVPLLLTCLAPPGLLIPILWVVGTAVFGVLARMPGVELRRLHHVRIPGRQLGWIVARWLLACIALTLLLYLLRPALLFRLPVQQPRLWLLVMLLYPVISVYPQTLIYRALFEARYATLFHSAHVSLLVGACLFSLAHLPFQNLWALALTLPGGYLFLSTYRSTGSIVLSAVEHALYGNALFTIGWGAYLYSGSVQMTHTLLTAVGP